MMPKPTLISIFSGCGGAALGFWQAGFEVRVFVEKDKACVQTLHRNWIDRRGMCKQRRKPVILDSSITLIPTRDILEAGGLTVGGADCLEGGFPCQGFSTSGKRELGDGRNILYRQCVRIIGEALPKTFMLENVPGLVSMERGAVIRMICADLVGCGYDLRWDIFDAANFGVPQRRRRVIMIGKRVDLAHVDFDTGRMSLVMGAEPGEVQHPDWFETKYPDRGKRTNERVKKHLGSGIYQRRQRARLSPES
jgi:DNA (cytosine-5)-methyltransferase 1